MSDQQSDADQKQSKPDAPNEPPQVFTAKIGQELQTEPADNQNGGGGDNQPPPNILTVPPKPDRWYTKVSLTDWITAISTLVIMVWAGLQWYEMHTGGIDTAAIAKAAKQQACAANRSAHAAQQFADTADDINGDLNEAVKKLDAQARAIEVSRKSSEAASSKALNTSIESSRLDQRAWMGVFQINVAEPSPDKGLPITVVFANSGKTPAYNAQMAGGYHFSQTPIFGPSRDEINRLDFHPAQATAPQGKLNDVLGYVTANGDISSASDLAGTEDIRTHYQSILEGKVTLYYYGTLKYDDAFGKPRTTNFCVYLADVKLKISAFCRDFNDLN